MARRQVASQGDAVIIAERIGEALNAVSYIVTPQRKPNVFEVVGFVPSARRYLGIVIKLVAPPRAKTGQDEWWVQSLQSDAYLESVTVCRFAMP